MIWTGDVLRLTRQSLGYSQEEVVELLGGEPTQAALSRYENGVRTPEPIVLVRLATIYGVTTEFLGADGRAFSAEAVDAHMRKQSTVPVAAWRRWEARLNVLRWHWASLIGRIPIVAERSIPTFDETDGINPEEAARRVRALWRMPVGPVVGLIAWLESAGCVVIEEDFGPNKIDGMSQWVGAACIIFLNASAPRDRKRLTLAHELGHLVLHSRVTNEDVEREASEFAAEFLMPAVAIRHELQLSKLDMGSLLRLKAEWKVSMQALFERANSLGFVTADQRRRFYQRLNQLRWKVSEPGEETVPVESPRLARHLVDQARDAGLTSQEILNLAGYERNTGDPLLSGAFGSSGLRALK